MTATFRPSAARGTVAAPPSKSAAHRMLVCAGLAGGESVLHGVSSSEDMLATMDCLRALGAKVRYENDTAIIQGNGGIFPQTAVLPCRECGSTLRFFVPPAWLCGGKVTLTGSKTLLSRPLSVYADIADQQGLLFRMNETALTVDGTLSAGAYTVAGNISSQFISGLCFALPLLSGESVIHITPPVESAPYIDMTLDVLRRFGISVDRPDAQTIRIPGNQSYSPVTADVEGDYSNAAFLDAFNFLDGDVQITGLKADSLQGDRVYSSLFSTIRQASPTIDLTDCPDLGPVCMALAAANHGATFVGTRRLRIKESDRCTSMAQELAKFGVSSRLEEDTMTIDPGTLHKPDSILCGHNDHRIVMALSLLLSKTGGSIDGAQAVRKSFPDFFETLRFLGIEVYTTDGMDS